MPYWLALLFAVLAAFHSVAAKAQPRVAQSKSIE